MEEKMKRNEFDEKMYEVLKAINGRLRLMKRAAQKHESPAVVSFLREWLADDAGVSAVIEKVEEEK